MRNVLQLVGLGQEREHRYNYVYNIIIKNIYFYWRDDTKGLKIILRKIIVKMHTIEQYLAMLGNTFIQELEMPADYLYSVRIMMALELHRWSMRQSDMRKWIILKRLSPRRLV